MSPEQEKKLDKVYEICLRTEGKFDVIDEKITQHRDTIIEQQKEISATKKDHDTRLETLEADKNKVLGMLWVASSSAFLGFCTLVASWFRK